FSNLTGLMFGGEASDPDVVRRLLNTAPPTRLIHVYGPTESTTFASWYEVNSVAADAETIPIGRPLANTTLYVLDAQRNPVPVGVPGELYIGGDGLASGYLNRPALTAERFVHNAFVDQGLLYRTGDRVRLHSSGDIEFLGRFDNQVKLRGFRIELGEIESALVSHDAIASATTVIREDEPGNKRLVAYVVPDSQWLDGIASAQSSEHINEWQALYEETYGDEKNTDSPTLNLSGWNSSYTGTAIPVEEMNEWVDATVSRLQSLAPERVLEIGCGTGLLLSRVAPACDYYVGTDFSSVAMKQLKALRSSDSQLEHVELWQRMADDFSGIAAADFNLVVINSVVQYFPAVDYLVDVIEGAVNAVRAGGCVFIGDIRSYPLLKAYHTSVQLYQSQDDTVMSSELLHNIEQHVEEENELVISPDIFHALKTHIPRISHVEVLLKKGVYHNELSRYRYDVILHVETESDDLPADGNWLNWDEDITDLSSLEQTLAARRNSWLGVSAMPNARVWQDITALQQLETTDTPQALAQIKQHAQQAEKLSIEPDKLWRLAQKYGYTLELSYAGSGGSGRMDALFRIASREDCAGRVYWAQRTDAPIQTW
ncbi:MAG TPA: methyltransferase, partial [Thiotrichales bacterium]|nr:methyltransferase [Thiotrichales bacterium]